EPGRQWLASILQGALESELLAPADVVRHLPPSEFVKDTPLPVMAELIKAGLLGGKFDPALVLQHLTPQVIAEHLESSLAWGCIAEAAQQRFELPGAVVQKPRDDENTGKIAVAKAANAGGVKSAPAPAVARGATVLRDTRIDAVPPRRSRDAVVSS